MSSSSFHACRARWHWTRIHAVLSAGKRLAKHGLRIEISRQNGSVFPPFPRYTRCPDSDVLDVSVTSSGSITFP